MFDKLRRFRWRWLGRREIRNQIKKLGRENKLKIILGAGTTHYDGWIATDLPFFDINRVSDWLYFFKTQRINRILAEHVLEHLTERQVKKVLQLSFKYLTKGGCFRMAVPDGFHTNPDYIEAVKPGGWDEGSDNHKSFWNINSLCHLAESLNYEVSPLEYFDEDGYFHFNNFHNKDGPIIRSRGKGHKDNITPDYSSLIVDLIKNS